MSNSTVPYGEWPSPLAASDLGAASRGFGSLRAANSCLYWNELRPAEGGRTVVMRLSPEGKIETLTPEGFNTRTRVHEYGGTPFVVAGDTVVFSNFADQRLYAQIGTGAPKIVTPEAALRYADGVYDPNRDRLICVREDHASETLKEYGEAKNTIAAVSLTDGTSTVLAEGPDFVAYPRLSPDGLKLAWTAWNHPNMPWDTVSLYVANMDSDGKTIPNPDTKLKGNRVQFFSPLGARMVISTSPVTGRAFGPYTHGMGLPSAP